MYKKTEKAKENNNRTVFNSAAQNKNSVNNDFGFVDNRAEATTQRKIRGLVNDAIQVKQEKKHQAKATNSIQKMNAYDEAEPLKDPRHFSTAAIKTAIDNCKQNGTAIPSWLKKQVSNYLRDELLERWQDMKHYSGGDPGHQHYFKLVQKYVDIVDSLKETEDGVPTGGPALQLKNDWQRMNK